MKFTEKHLIVLVAIAGGIFVLTGTAFYKLWEGSATGIPAIDRFRMWVVLSVIKNFGVNARVEYVRAVMSIINNESRGAKAPVVGDILLGGGPSIGPMQIYRSTAKSMRLYVPTDGLSDEAEREDYKNLAFDEKMMIDWGVRVFKEKLRIASGDVAGAIRRYNGSGPNAEAYRDRALAFAGKTWGGLS